MWSISFPINLYTVMIAILAPFLLLMVIVEQPFVALLVGGPIVALVAWRRAARRRRLAAEANAIAQHERHLAELQAEAIARRLQRP